MKCLPIMNVQLPYKRKSKLFFSKRENCHKNLTFLCTTFSQEKFFFFIIPNSTLKV